jgi:hypothetical protein
VIYIKKSLVKPEKLSSIDKVSLYAGEGCEIGNNCGETGDSCFVGDDCGYGTNC